MKRKVWFIFFIIFSFSLFLRLSFHEAVEFKQDEAAATLRSGDIVTKHQLPATGLVSSVGIRNPPFFLYLMALPSLFKPYSPLILTGFISLVNSLAVGLFFLVLNQFFSLSLAIFAAFLFAASPWASLFSRKIWAQNLLPFFSVLLFYFILKLTEKKEKKAVVPITAITILMAQLHYSGLFLLPLVILVLFYSRKKIKISFLLWGIFLGILPLIPYLVFQQQNNFIDLKNLINPGQYPIFADWQVFLRPFQLANGFYFEFVLGRDYLQFISQLPYKDIIFKIFWAEIIFALAGIGYLLRQNRFKYLLPLYWFFLIPAILYWKHIYAYPHYFIITYPFIFLFTGQFLSFLWQKKWLKIPTAIIFLLIIFAKLTFLFSFYRFISIKGKIEGDFGTIYRLKKNIPLEEIARTLPDQQPEPQNQAIPAE